MGDRLEPPTRHCKICGIVFSSYGDLYCGKCGDALAWYEGTSAMMVLSMGGYGQ